MRVFLTSILLFTTTIATAHPVSYKGAIGVMAWNQPFMSDYWTTFSFRSDMAVAARAMRMEMPDGRLNYTGAQLDYLLYRKNETEYQANIYLYGGAGNVQFQGEHGEGYLGGVEADTESRKYFGLLKAETMQSSFAPVFNHVEARLGIAPYESEYDEISSWFMVQAQWHPNLERKFVLTPLARFFYKSVLFELGVSLEGDYMTNFMFHF